eukprot:c35561_g1_i1 orf=53-391(-)
MQIFMTLPSAPQQRSSMTFEESPLKSKTLRQTFYIHAQKFDMLNLLDRQVRETCSLVRERVLLEIITHPLLIPNDRSPSLQSEETTNIGVVACKAPDRHPYDLPQPCFATKI